MAILVTKGIKIADMGVHVAILVTKGIKIVSAWGLKKVGIIKLLSSTFY
ncbi:hypothetical protein [Paenibacillus apis]|uniref:Uncharacterized protein n=1 Tax=Paenibacillus apis TaxID=1792174 RepID=A0A919YAF1_9BACL|nr:hypothetical protein [Paenibacillus apis]GIO44962.1 hypothetical protein J41TS4_47200 [Paenibacillus apis]